ncbi:NAD(P)H-dependent oxidoreductase (plasmid) [Macrococcoides canis]|uniref:flavodoxin family protein n=1 Tax=Macrococcoides canis TaxID=1855823 RepID=UPI001F314510|nr:NAD(P)H-dependent oxidoreductase [Macrococcus canis]UJS29012.1 NAD(P)H-dependent oxidoreductase [Macrococcus canis]
MKKIFIINGSRNKSGNTANFIKFIINELNSNYKFIWMYPQDYTILPVYESYDSNYNEDTTDDIGILKKQILESDLLIIASPVYMHSMSADLKFLIERLVEWSHTFILDGKPTVILSTCNSNGHDKVIKPISEIVTYMGGNIIANSNASYTYEFQNIKVIKEISYEIAKRITKFLEMDPQSNADIEKKFINTQNIVRKRIDYKRLNNIELDWEDSHWIETGKINYSSFSEYLRGKCNEN